jgi:tRNA 2-selenouridine synthase
MAILQISIQQLLDQAGQYPVLDVRSPGEYGHAHIPWAYNLPLFSDEERKVVGTAYKKEGKARAIKAGLAFFGPKMVAMVEEAEKLIGQYPVAPIQGEAKGDGSKRDAAPKTVVVHCWRGGMRSAGVAWLLDLYGFDVFTLTGGYKSFRRWCGRQFAKPYPFSILGGYTGSGKTGILGELKACGKAVLDLEALASHKGSVFGHLGEQPQPTQEMFENRLALALAGVDQAANADQAANMGAAGSLDRSGDTDRSDGLDQAGDTDRSDGLDQAGNTDQSGGKDRSDNMDQASTIWLEDESQRIGSVNIPTSLYRHMQTRPVYFLEIPFEERLNYIVRTYGQFEKDGLAEAIIRLKKRLGGLETKTALAYLEEGDLPGCFGILLKYYDKYYLKSLAQKQPALTAMQPSSAQEPTSALQVKKLPCTGTDAAANASLLLGQTGSPPSPSLYLHYNQTDEPNRH